MKVTASAKKRIRFTCVFCALWFLPIFAEKAQEKVVSEDLLAHVSFLGMSEEAKKTVHTEHRKGRFTRIEHGYAGKVPKNRASKVFLYVWLVSMLVFGFGMFKRYERGSFIGAELREGIGSFILPFSIVFLLLSFILRTSQNYFFLTDTGLLLVHGGIVTFFKYEALVSVKIMKMPPPLMGKDRFGRIVNAQGECYDFLSNSFASEYGFTSLFIHLQKKVERKKGRKK